MLSWVPGVCARINKPVPEVLTEAMVRARCSAIVLRLYASHAEEDFQTLAQAQHHAMYAGLSDDIALMAWGALEAASIEDTAEMLGCFEEMIRDLSAVEGTQLIDTALEELVREEV